MNQDGEIPILGFQKFVMTAPGPGPGTIDKLQRQRKFESSCKSTIS